MGRLYEVYMVSIQNNEWEQTETNRTYYKEERDRNSKISKGNICQSQRKDGKVKTDTEVMGCDRVK